MSATKIPRNNADTKDNLDHDQCSMEIREVADTLELLGLNADGNGGAHPDLLVGTLCGLARRLNQLADSVDRLDGRGETGGE